MKTVKNIFLLFFVFGCASSLKELNELGDAPQQMDQKIEDVASGAAVVAPPEAKLEEVKVKSKAKSKKVTPTKEEKLPKVAARKAQPDFVDKWPFSVGEKSTYVVRYGPIEGGKATIEVAPVKKLNGELALHYIARVRSHKVFDLFYKVEDVLQTWTRLKDHLPLRQEILQNESGEWGRRVVIFNQKIKQQHFYSSTTRPKRPTKIIDEKHTLYNNPQDMFGAYFFGRFVKDPKKITFPVHDRFKHWNNEYIFDGKEEVKTKAGTFMCNRYKVFPRVQGNLEPKGAAFVWLTDDERRLMTKFNVKIRIGSITGDLVEYQPGSSWEWQLPEFSTPLNLDPAKLVDQNS